MWLPPGDGLASMVKKFGARYPIRADAAFKLPIFMPATVTLGHEPAKGIEENQPFKILPDETRIDETKINETKIDFELRDEKKGLPHLKGQFEFNRKEN